MSDLSRWPWSATIFLGLVIAAAIGVISLNAYDRAHSPCAIYVDGYSETTDDMGQRAFVARRWCVVWKKGYGPEGGAP